MVVISTGDRTGILTGRSETVSNIIAQLERIPQCQKSLNLDYIKINKNDFRRCYWHNKLEWTILLSNILKNKINNKINKIMKGEHPQTNISDRYIYMKENETSAHLITTYPLGAPRLLNLWGCWMKEETN